MNSSLKGFLCALSAFLIWGLSPVYWKTLTGVPAFEIVLHRVVWSFLFLLPLLPIQKRTGEFLSVMKHPRTLATLLATTLLVAVNWLLFIWSVNNGLVLQASLGYYINPLFSVLLGVVILGERLRRAQVIAVLLAAAGVLHLTIGLGRFPWIALSLAFTFGLYGLVRKIAPVSALVGLAVETLLMLPPSLGYLTYLYLDGRGAFLHSGTSIDLLLMASALATALPLLLFNLGTRILHLSTIGFMQYIVPSCFFLFAVFVFGESISSVQLWTFALIWAALALYTADSMLLHGKTLAPLASKPE
ncbi:MAG: EamA family transporter RarD [Syntrophobacteraceae bacterium]|jgi:chloramphenicol-sensitive protein RarD|nr:EamA family transporter RarD [Syntrophobacteraceae bacterium]MCU0589474.1 EamA family transporter RarD [Syntrophobacteraceae bacterium]